MRTTVRLDQAVVAKAKKASARTGGTLTAMIERGLRLVLARAGQRRRKTIILISVSRASGWPACRSESG